MVLQRPAVAFHVAGDGAVQQAGVEVRQAEVRGNAHGQRPLARRGRPVDGDDHRAIPTTRRRRSKRGSKYPSNSLNHHNRQTTTPARGGTMAAAITTPTDHLLFVSLNTSIARKCAVTSKSPIKQIRRPSLKSFLMAYARRFSSRAPHTA